MSGRTGRYPAKEQYEQGSAGQGRHHRRGQVAHRTSSTAVVTEYRGLTVAQISTLRRQLRTLGADYKVFKNTLVRRAIAGTDVESLAEFLVGPTAIAFVDGDVSAVAKALRDFARETPKLIVKAASSTANRSP